MRFSTFTKCFDCAVTTKSLLFFPNWWSIYLLLIQHRRNQINQKWLYRLILFYFFLVLKSIWMFVFTFFREKHPIKYHSLFSFDSHEFLCQHASALNFLLKLSACIRNTQNCGTLKLLPVEMSHVNFGCLYSIYCVSQFIFINVNL